MSVNTMHVTGLSRRHALAGLSSAGLGLALGSQVRGVSAEVFSTAGHPLVGSWLLENTPENPTTAYTLFSVHADGTYVEASADGTVRLGSWEATGPTTATLTIEAYSRDEAGSSQGGLIIRLKIQSNPDGNSYTAEGTIERIAPDGSRSGQAGPATGAATRMMVEAPGTPVMSLDELFGGAGSMPEATPAT
jgi:hypothetical protein